MANAHSFSLLRLPYLALVHTIKLMMVEELFNFSTISKRMQWIVKRSTSRREFTCEVDFLTSGKILIGYQTDLFELECDDPMTLLPQITETFHKLKFTIFAGAGASKDLLKTFFNSVKEQKLSVELVMASYEGEGAQDAFCQTVFDNCRSSVSCCINLETSSEFRLDLKDQFNVTNLTILGAHYFKVNHLIYNFMNCSRIHLFGAKLPIGDLNLFLKNWIIQKSKIESFTYHQEGDRSTREPLDRRVLDGIPCTPVRKAIWDDDRREFGENECFHIRQEGGLEALVNLNLNSAMYLTAKFVLG